jgi:hypothetical protein
VSRIALLVTICGPAIPRPEYVLSDWQTALIVAAHPDVETFGLGAIVDRLTSGGTAVQVLCFIR